MSNVSDCESINSLELENCVPERECQREHSEHELIPDEVKYIEVVISKVSSPHLFSPHIDTGPEQIESVHNIQSNHDIDLKDQKTEVSRVDTATQTVSRSASHRSRRQLRTNKSTSKIKKKKSSKGSDSSKSHSRGQGLSGSEAVGGTAESIINKTKSTKIPWSKYHADCLDSSVQPKTCCGRSNPTHPQPAKRKKKISPKAVQVTDSEKEAEPVHHSASEIIVTAKHSHHSEDQLRTLSDHTGLNLNITHCSSLSSHDNSTSRFLTDASSEPDCTQSPEIQEQSCTSSEEEHHVVLQSHSLSFIDCFAEAAAPIVDGASCSKYTASTPRLFQDTLCMPTGISGDCDIISDETYNGVECSPLHTMDSDHLLNNVNNLTTRSTDSPNCRPSYQMYGSCSEDALVETSCGHVKNVPDSGMDITGPSAAKRQIPPVPNSDERPPDRPKDCTNDVVTNGASSSAKFQSPTPTPSARIMEEPTKSKPCACRRQPMTNSPEDVKHEQSTIPARELSELNVKSHKSNKPVPAAEIEDELQSSGSEHLVSRELHDIAYKSPLPGACTRFAKDSTKPHYCTGHRSQMTNDLEHLRYESPTIISAGHSEMSPKCPTPSPSVRVKDESTRPCACHRKPKADGHERDKHEAQSTVPTNAPAGLGDNSHKLRTHGPCARVREVATVPNAYACRSEPKADGQKHKKHESKTNAPTYESADRADKPPTSSTPWPCSLLKEECTKAHYCVGHRFQTANDLEHVKHETQTVISEGQAEVSLKPTPCPSTLKPTPCPSTLKPTPCPSSLKPTPCTSIRFKEEPDEPRPCSSHRKHTTNDSQHEANESQAIISASHVEGPLKSTPCPSTLKPTPCPSSLKPTPCPSKRFKEEPTKPHPCVSQRQQTASGPELATHESPSVTPVHEAASLPAKPFRSQTYAPCAQVKEEPHPETKPRKCVCGRAIDEPQNHEEIVKRAVCKKRSNTESVKSHRCKSDKSQNILPDPEDISMQPTEQARSCRSKPKVNACTSGSSKLQTKNSYVILPASGESKIKQACDNKDSAPINAHPPCPSSSLNPEPESTMKDTIPQTSRRGSQQTESTCDHPIEHQASRPLPVKQKSSCENSELESRPIPKSESKPASDSKMSGTCHKGSSSVNKAQQEYASCTSKTEDNDQDLGPQRCVRCIMSENPHPCRHSQPTEIPQPQPFQPHPPPFKRSSHEHRSQEKKSSHNVDKSACEDISKFQRSNGDAAVKSEPFTDIHAIVISNFQTNICASKMMERVTTLIQRVANVQVNPQNVHIIEKEAGERRIFVYLPDVDKQSQILQAFLQCDTSILVQPYTLASVAYENPAPKALTPPPRPHRRGCAGAAKEKVCPWNCARFYTLGQRVGNETRQVEFKAGQGNIECSLTEVVCKYMSAFLNSNGGTLIFGINDSGEVIGVPNCTHAREDKLRQRIDSAVKFITPQLFPHSYIVRFLPVKDCLGQDIENTKVIEICTEAGLADDLYQTPNGEVFIRRDGSVQGPLKASDIQEWTRTSMKKRSNREAELKDTEGKLSIMKELDCLRQADRDHKDSMSKLKAEKLEFDQQRKKLNVLAERIDKMLSTEESRPTCSRSSPPQSQPTGHRPPPPQSYPTCPSAKQSRPPQPQSYPSCPPPPQQLRPPQPQSYPSCPPPSQQSQPPCSRPPPTRHLMLANEGDSGRMQCKDTIPLRTQVSACPPIPTPSPCSKSTPSRTLVDPCKRTAAPSASQTHPCKKSKPSARGGSACGETGGRAHGGGPKTDTSRDCGGSWKFIEHSDTEEKQENRCQRNAQSSSCPDECVGADDSDSIVSTDSNDDTAGYCAQHTTQACPRSPAASHTSSYQTSVHPPVHDCTTKVLVRPQNREQFHGTHPHGGPYTWNDGRPQRPLWRRPLRKRRDSRMYGHVGNDSFERSNNDTIVVVRPSDLPPERGHSCQSRSRRSRTCSIS